MTFSTREYGFLALGLLAAVWFFVAYPSQDPRSIIDLSLEKEQVLQKAEAQLEAWGYTAQNFQSDVRVEVNRSLLDSLQKDIGRPELIQKMRTGTIENLVPFYWNVSFRPTADNQSSVTFGTDSEEDQGPPEEDENTIRMHFDMNGHLTEVLNLIGSVSINTINPKALASAFETDRKQIRQLLSTTDDSLIANQFIIDLSHTDRFRENLMDRLGAALDQGPPILLSRKEVLRMSAYYLNQTGWNTAALQADSVYLGRFNGLGTATARYRWTDPKLQQELHLYVRLTGTGGLININSAYNENGDGTNGFREIWPVLRSALIFLFCIAAIIIFFFRIRARAIDTSPALVIAILGGLAVSVEVLLSSIEQINFFSNPDNWMVGIFIVVGVGISGAIASLGFFVLSAIGDSITRQHWEEKLEMYNYLRQGMFFNKPIGFMLMRSVVLAFMLAGLWTFMLWLMPTLYFDMEHVFSQDRAVFPTLFLILHNGWFSLCIVLGIFLVLGGQVYAQTKNRVVASLTMIVACAILVPVTGSYGPVLQEILIAAILGTGLTLIYIRWEAMTLLLSHLLFLGLISTSTGWIVEKSIDGYLFLFFIIVVAVLFVAGLWTAIRGKEESMLSRFVPDYVEELAQEERIKQELRIAREVQQSFLPIRTPHFDHLELSAICRPAYETGGDYYDFVPLDGRRVAVAIGDVSGKGIQAAFYMTFIKGILHSLCREINSPAELLKKTNRLFCDNATPGVFISLVYGIIDLDKQEFRFARAGHNPILHIDGTSNRVEELQPRGIGVGLAAGAPFDDNIEEVTLKLEMGDSLILYTDGIVEALNENHTFYGSHRLNNLLKRHSNSSAAHILDVLSGDVQSYIGEAKQHDDMTIVVMKLRS